MEKLLVICGATASGKTSLAVDCAKKLNSEVISADSQLIYKGLDIGTAKPAVGEMQGVKHHLIDIVDPWCSFSVSEYAQLAEPVIQELINKGKVPVICGGTGFYINSLLFDLSYGNVQGNSTIREKYSKLLQQYGKDYLYNYLKEVDPETAEKLAGIPNMAGIKEASGNMAQASETMRRIRGKIDLYSGEDFLNLPMLAIGGAGLISVASNIVPALLKKIYTSVMQGRLKEANEVQDSLLPLIDACFTEVNPIPVKAACNMIGFDAGLPRSPLTELEEGNKQKLLQAIKNLGIKTV